MKKVILNSRSAPPSCDWSEWRIVWLIKEYQNTWHIWSLREPFGRYVHKESMGLRITPL